MSAKLVGHPKHFWECLANRKLFYQDKFCEGEKEVGHQTRLEMSGIEANGSMDAITGKSKVSIDWWKGLASLLAEEQRAHSVSNSILDGTAKGYNIPSEMGWRTMEMDGPMHTSGKGIYVITTICCHNGYK
jgi:hypothetical protein